MTSRRTRLVWLLACALGALHEWMQVWERASVPPDFTWTFDMRMEYLEFAVGEGLFWSAGVLAVAGIAGGLGLLDGLFQIAGRLARDAMRSGPVRSVTASTRVRWSFVVAVLPWSVALLYGYSVVVSPTSGAPSPTFSNYTIGVMIIFAALAGFLVTAIGLWVVLYLVAMLRRLIARVASRSS